MRTKRQKKITAHKKVKKRWQKKGILKKTYTYKEKHIFQEKFLNLIRKNRYEK